MAVVRLGISTFITQLAIVIVAILCNVQLARYGELSKYGKDIPIAIIGIVSKVFTVVINLVVGIVLGSQPIISYNVGAKKYDRVKELYRKIKSKYPFVNAIFTVHEKQFAIENNIDINCGGKSCNACGKKCYEKSCRVTLINELKK